MVTFEELKKMTHAELEKEILRITTEQLKLRLAVHSKQSTETHKLKQMKKYIAQINTLKNTLPDDKLPENPKSHVTK